VKETLSSEVQNDLQTILSESQRNIIAIVEQNTIAYRPEGFGFTTEEYANLPTFPYGQETARTVLNKLVKEGKLEKKKVMINNSPGFIFYEPGTWPE